MYGLILWTIAAIVVGLGIGTIMMDRIDRRHMPKKIGTLRIDNSDPDGPYLFLELDKGVSEVQVEKEIALEVKVQNFAPKNQ